MEQNHLVGIPNVWNIHSSTIPSWILLFLPPCLLEEYWHFICLQLGPSLSPCCQESWEQRGPPEVPARVLNLIFLESSSWHYLLFQPPWSMLTSDFGWVTLTRACSSFEVYSFSSIIRASTSQLGDVGTYLYFISLVTRKEDGGERSL